MPAKAAADIEARPSGKQERRARTSLPLTERVYTNEGNPPVVSQIDNRCRRILDIGCGAGDNAALLKSRIPECEIFGVTRSDAEAERARAYMTECWVDDIEENVPDYLLRERFDCIIFSHVLEHLRDPAAVVARFSQLLNKGGSVAIAIPNVLYVGMRLEFLRGNFEYNPDGGILDDTHLHFYTCLTADRYLLAKSADLKLANKIVDGHIPMPGLRGRVIPRTWCKAIDRWGLRHWPNLFGYQIILKAVKL